MEYRSSTELFGLPLVHVVTGGIVDGRYRRGVATAWLAVGDLAFGALFACGGVAVGSISVGGIAIGALPVGGLALGALSFGGLALGWIAVGGVAFGWHAAVGGLAVAHLYATGGVAIAPQIVPPPPSSIVPFAPIPHAPFRWSDAGWFALIVWALLLVAGAVQARRNR
jgi:hypothetical protein